MVHRGGRQHGVEAASVGKASFDHRRGAVYAETEGSNDSLHGSHQLLVGGETDLGRFQSVSTIDPHLVGTVDENVGDNGVVDQALGGSETHDTTHDPYQIVFHMPGRLCLKETEGLALDAGAVEGRRSESDGPGDPIDHAHGIPQT